MEEIMCLMKHLVSGCHGKQLSFFLNEAIGRHKGYCFCFVGIKEPSEGLDELSPKQKGQSKKRHIGRRV